MHDKLEILDIEEKADTFEVVFEVPGGKFGQSYPKRLTHSFPLKDHFFEEVNEQGERRFEKILKKNYLKTSDKEKERERKGREKVKELKEKFRGKKFEDGKK